MTVVTLLVVHKLTQLRGHLGAKENWDHIVKLMTVTILSKYFLHPKGCAELPTQLTVAALSPEAVSSPSSEGSRLTEEGSCDPSAWRGHSLVSCCNPHLPCLASEEMPVVELTWPPVHLHSDHHCKAVLLTSFWLLSRDNSVPCSCCSLQGLLGRRIFISFKQRYFKCPDQRQSPLMSAIGQTPCEF